MKFKINNNLSEDYSGNGYSGYSMSNNAVDAYDNGEKPKSKWTKSDILLVIKKELGEQIAKKFTGVKGNVLKDNLLEKTSWHHTSSMYNKTDFYSVNINKVKTLTDDDIKKLSDESKNVDEKEKPNIYKGNINYIEWEGTRKHPKAIKKSLDNVNIEERGSFYIITDDNGNEILRKKMFSNGTYVNKIK